MIVTFMRHKEKEDGDIKRFWAAYFDGERVALAVIRWSKRFSRLVHGRYNVSYDETDTEIVKAVEYLKPHITKSLSKTGSVSRLEVCMPESSGSDGEVKHEDA